MPDLFYSFGTCHPGAVTLHNYPRHLQNLRRDDGEHLDLAAVDILRGKGLKIDLVMIQRQTHGKALAMKADADLTFDSFWLGIQGSGLEAASMGQMVVAGDESVRDLYVESEVGVGSAFFVTFPPQRSSHG